MTIRELIDSYQSEIKNKDITPDRAAELLNKLASIMGNINDRILETDIAYNSILKKALEENEKANRAVIVAKCSPEYKEMMEAKNTEKEAIYLIRSLNRFLRVKEDEARTTRFQ